jgi:hypothetical protein
MYRVSIVCMTRVHHRMRIDPHRMESIGSDRFVIVLYRSHSYSMIAIESYC